MTRKLEFSVRCAIMSVVDTTFLFVIAIPLAIYLLVMLGSVLNVTELTGGESSVSDEGAGALAVESSAHFSTGEAQASAPVESSRVVEVREPDSVVTAAGEALEAERPAETRTAEEARTAREISQQALAREETAGSQDVAAPSVAAEPGAENAVLVFDAPEPLEHVAEKADTVLAVPEARDLVGEKAQTFVAAPEAQEPEKVKPEAAERTTQAVETEQLKADVGETAPQPLEAEQPKAETLESAAQAAAAEPRTAESEAVAAEAQEAGRPTAETVERAPVSAEEGEKENAKKADAAQEPDPKKERPFKPLEKASPKYVFDYRGRLWVEKKNRGFFRQLRKPNLPPDEPQ